MVFQVPETDLICQFGMQNLGHFDRWVVMHYNVRILSASISILESSSIRLLETKEGEDRSLQPSRIDFVDKIDSTNTLEVL